MHNSYRVGEKNTRNQCPGILIVLLAEFIVNHRLITTILLGVVILISSYPLLIGYDGSILIANEGICAVAGIAIYALGIRWLCNLFREAIDTMRKLSKTEDQIENIDRVAYMIANYREKWSYRIFFAITWLFLFIILVKYTLYYDSIVDKLVINGNLAKIIKITHFLIYLLAGTILSEGLTIVASIIHIFYINGCELFSKILDPIPLPLVIQFLDPFQGVVKKTVILWFIESSVSFLGLIYFIKKDDIIPILLLLIILLAGLLIYFIPQIPVYLYVRKRRTFELHYLFNLITSKTIGHELKDHPHNLLSLYNTIKSTEAFSLFGILSDVLVIVLEYLIFNVLPYYITTLLE